ncbi:hypothetical protein PUN28_011149 [Cardiocondyla obscurior]|uniref:Uncharacterized protein n=1 Tax=Cardiocondyla obscurior TaxID=286306 RepID=A0AAW2FL01_9HYME
MSFSHCALLPCSGCDIFYSSLPANRERVISRVRTSRGNGRKRVTRDRSLGRMSARDRTYVVLHCFVSRSTAAHETARGPIRPVRSLIVIDAHHARGKKDHAAMIRLPVQFAGKNNCVGGNAGTWIWIITHANDFDRSGGSWYCRKYARTASPSSIRKCQGVTFTLCYLFRTPFAFDV